MKTKLWHRTIATFLFLPILLTSTIMIGVTLVDAISAFVIYLLIALSVSVGYHRLFTHNSFKCSKLYSYVMAFVGSATLNSSPIQWVSTHVAHHKFSDTDKDPYESSLKYFFRFKEDRDIPLSKNAMRLYKDKYHKFLYNHSFSIFLSIVVILYFVNYNVLLIYFLLPVTTYLVINGLHTIFAHDKEGPKNMKYLELIIPMWGEWIHKNHHENSHMPYYNSIFDFGSFIIRIIRNDR